MGKEVIEREESGAEDEYDERRKHKGEWIGNIEFARIAQNRCQRLAIRGDVGDEHVTRKQKTCKPGGETNDQQNTAEKFKRSNSGRRQPRGRNTEAREKLLHVRQMMQLTPTRLRELPSPVKPHQQ